MDLNKNNNRLRIGIDIDEVIAETINPLNDFYNQNYKKNFTFEDYFVYDLDKVWNIEKKQSSEIVNNFFNSEFKDNIFPINGSQEAVKKLSKNHSLFAITLRSEKLNNLTFNWLETHFPKIFSNVFFSEHSYEKIKKMNKSDVCADNKISILIEDNAYIAKECSEKGIKVFLMDKPWNKDLKENENIIRIKNWEEVLNHLKC